MSIALAVAFMASSAAAWASAGITGGDACCCPVKSKCKCHDHDGDGPSTPVMKRCATKNELVTPAVQVLLQAEPVEAAIEMRVSVIATHAPEPMPEDWSIAPERPPF